MQVLRRGTSPTANAVPPPLKGRAIFLSLPIVQISKKIPPVPLRNRAGPSVAQKRADIAPVPLILRKQDATPMTDLLARFAARLRPSRFPSGYGSVEKRPVHSACAICTVYLSQFLFRARSPYSCGTAQASHLFSRHEETVSSLIASKARRLCRPKYVSL